MQQIVNSEKFWYVIFLGITSWATLITSWATFGAYNLEKPPSLHHLKNIIRTLPRFTKTNKQTKLKMRKNKYL